MFSYLWNFSPQRNLKKIKAQIKKHTQRFNDEVQAIHRQELRAQIKGIVPRPPNKNSAAENRSHKIRKINAIEKFRNLDFYGREEDLASLQENPPPRERYRIGE